MLFQPTPAPLNRVVLAVIRWIVSQFYSDPRCGHEVHKARQELRPTTVTFGSVVEVEQQRRHVWEAGSVGFPPPTEQVCQTVAGHFGSHGVEGQVIVFGQQNPDGRNGRLRVKVMIGGVDLHPVLAAARRLPDFHRRLGVEGQAQNRGVGIGFGVDLAQSLEDGVGLSDLFLGRLF